MPNAIEIPVHPVSPESRRINQICDVLSAGGVVMLPTDSNYALVARLGDFSRWGHLCTLRRTSKDHLFTIMCRTISEMSQYAVLTNTSLFRYIKQHTPGPYTFILQATKQVPRRLSHKKRRTIGVRLPSHCVIERVLETLGSPLMSMTARVPESEDACDYGALSRYYFPHIDASVEGDTGCGESTVIDMSAGSIDVVRQGCGKIDTM